MKNAIAIIGFGCAGFHALKSLREHGYAGTIDVYTDTAWAPANPMLTTYYVYGKLNREGTLPFGNAEEIASRYRCNLIKEPAIRVSSPERSVLLGDGTSHAYDGILISTGAYAFVPPFPGADLPGVLSMRTMEDANKLKETLDSSDIRRALVVGASMVGIKLVELFEARGIDCTLADLAPRIFPLASVPVVSDEIEKRLRDHGVHLAFGKSLSSVQETENGLQVKFADDDTIDCDLVIVCIGTRANTAVADEHIIKNRGIVVDTHMQTNMPGIYSAGDCCEGNNLQSGETQIIGIWDNAARQGETAGANLAGVSASYDGNFLHNITHFMGMDFIGFGDNRIRGTEHIIRDEERGRIYYICEKDGVPVCVNLLDTYASSGVFKSYIVNRFRGEKMPYDPICIARMQKDHVPSKVIRLLFDL